MKTQFLSQEERGSGKKKYFSFTLFNGLGYGFLADTTIYLLAIHFGASNMALGYISSLLYLSGVVLLFTPKIIEGKNLIKTFFWAWFLRGAVCLINVIVLFVSNQIAVAVILLSYTLFCIFRIIGSSMSTPVIQTVSTPSTLGNMLTHNTAYFNFGSIFGKIGSFILVSFELFKGLAGLMVLQGAGFIFNTIASIFINKIPCREKIEVTPGQNIFVALLKNITDKKKLLPLLLYWNYMSIMVFAGFSIPLLKKVVGLEQNIIFLYTIIIAIATTIAMYMVRPFIDRVSGKLFIIITTLFDVAFFILWAFVKRTTPIYIIFILGFLWMFLKGANQSFISKILVLSIPGKDRVTYNSMINFFAGVFALLFGFIAGFAGDFGEKYHPAFFNQYYIIFLIAAVLAFLNFLLGFLVPEKIEGDLKKSFDLMSAFENVKSLINIYQFDKEKNPEKRQAILVSLKYKSAPFAISEIKKILKNPLSSDTEEVLKSLFVKPRPKLLPNILELAGDKGFYHRTTAIFALGAYTCKEVENALIRFLDDESPRIKSNAAKSLSRIGNKDFIKKFIDLSNDPENTSWDLMNYIIAILTVDRNSDFLKNMFNISEIQSQKSYKQSIFSLFSRILEFNPELSEIYQKENYEKFSGFKIILDEARYLDIFYKNSNLIKDFFINSNYKEIWNLFKVILKNKSHSGANFFINEAIQNFDESKIDETNTLALIYFSFFILFEEEE
jgi:hypothetical protein